MYKYRRIRTNRCRDKQLRKDMHKYPQDCTDKCKCMQIRTNAYKHVQMCTHAYKCVETKQTKCFQIRIDTYKHIQLLTKAYRYVENTCECVQAETGGHKAKQHMNIGDKQIHKSDVTHGCDNENQKLIENTQRFLWRLTMQNRTKADTDDERKEMGACCSGCK